MPFNEQDLSHSWSRLAKRASDASLGHITIRTSAFHIDLSMIMCFAGGCADRQTIRSPFVCTLQSSEVLVFVRNEDDIDGIDILGEIEAEGSAQAVSLRRSGQEVNLIEETIPPAQVGGKWRKFVHGSEPRPVPIIVTLSPTGAGVGNVTIKARFVSRVSRDGEADFDRFRKRLTPRIRPEDKPISLQATGRMS
jgi:hypothetical protein